MKSKKEKISIIKANLTTNELMDGIPFVSFEYCGESTIEIAVLAKESDRVLSILLERGCSILQLQLTEGR